MKTKSLLHVLISFALSINLGQQVWAQNLSAFEIVDNESVGLTVAPMEKGGVSVVDIDNNGWPDICTVRFDGPGYSRIYLNQNGHFTDITNQTPLKQIEGQEARTFSVVFADYDNDGDKDCSFGTSKALHLLRNDNNTFIEVSTEKGFVGHIPGFVSRYYYNIGGWADYDLDGDLDCVVSQENYDNLYLFRNDGDYFTDAAEEAGLFSTILAEFWNLGWTDWDLDGDSDLFSIHHFSANDEGIFTDVTDTLGLQLTNVVNREFFDFDNDGDLDYWKCTGDPEFSPTCELWENQDGVYIDISDDVGASLWRDNFRGLAIGDVDNDGDQDIFIQLDIPQSRDVLLVNEEIEPGVRVFDDVAEFVGITKIGDRKGVAFFDYDRDGFLDIYLPSAEHNHILYHNLGNNGANWIGFILEGTLSNRDAVGSIVTIYIGEQIQLRDTKAGSGWLRQGNPCVHFGIGFETNIDSVVIRWPLGYRQVLSDVAISQYHEIKEPDYTAVEQRAVSITHPKEFKLKQNFPNPFNPSTTIQYDLSENGFVKLGVYNLMGQKVATLVNQKQAAGTHEIQWNGTDEMDQRVSSGIYIYRVEAGNKFFESMKMVLTE